MLSALPKSIRHRLLPHITALALLLPVYVITTFVTGHPMLAVALAAVTALATFLVVRLIRLRGKLTLSLTVFGFPLLIALGFACFAGLNPFFKQQRQADMLRDAGLNFYGRRPDAMGEWKRTQDGIMLPIWLANRIGPDCMTKIDSINSGFEQLQRVRYRNLERSKRKRITLRRDDRTPAISPDLIAWLNELDEPQLTFFIDHFSDDDGKALQKLQQTHSTISLTINDRTGDLSRLGRVGNLKIHGDRLTSVQAEQISALPNLYALELNLLEIPADSLRALAIQQGYGILRIKSGNLDDAAWHALAEVPCQGLDLTDIDLTNAPDRTHKPARIPPVNASGFAWRLSIASTNVYTIRKAIRFFGRTHLMLDAPFTEARVNTLWGSRNLRFIQFRAPGTHDWKTVKRLAANK